MEQAIQTKTFNISLFRRQYWSTEAANRLLSVRRILVSTDPF